MNLDACKDQQYSEPGSLEIFATFNIGASGAATLAVGGRGLNRTTPISRSSAGVYTLNLLEGVNAILDWSINTKSAGITAATALRAVVTTVTPGGATPLLGFTMVNAGVATEIVSGDVLYCKITVRNTGASPL